MKGCLTIFLVILLLTFFIVGLFKAPVFTLIVASITLGLFILRRKQKEQQAEEERQQAILRARQRSDLFEFDTSVGINEIKRYEQARNPIAWAEALQRRYNNAEAALNDALIVVNDDIDKLAAYRQQLSDNQVQMYERVIQPFKNELLLCADRIPHPHGLVVVTEFTFPQDMQPQAISKKIISLMSNSGSQLSKYVSTTKDLSNLEKSDYFLIAIQFFIVWIRFKKAQEEQITEVLKLQGNINKTCEQISGAIKALGEAADDIKYLYKQHEDTISFMRQYFKTVQALANMNKSLESLSKEERQSVEALYIGRKQLKRLMEVDIMKSNDN
jgi:hypothetical protein